MSAASQRAARLEQRAADVLGGVRVKRTNYRKPAPDVWAIRLESGAVLQCEAKTRAKLPRIATLSLEQAQRYAPHALPVGVIRQKGGRALATMYLDDLAKALGLRETDYQLGLQLTPNKGR